MADPFALVINVRTGCRRGMLIGLRSGRMSFSASWPMLRNRLMRSLRMSLLGMLFFFLRESRKTTEQGHCKKCDERFHAIASVRQKINLVKLEPKLTVSF